MTIYTPVRPLTLLGKASDFYWSNRLLCDSALFIGTIVLVAVMLVVMA